MKIEDKLVHAIIATQVNIHKNEELSKTPFYDKDVKRKGNLFLNHIIKKEKFFEAFAEQVEDSAIDVHDVFFDFIENCASVTIPQMEGFNRLLEAYQKDHKSIDGIVKKIMK